MTQTHSIIINNHEYLIAGGDTKTLKEFANILGIDYESLTPSKISATQGLIKVWKIGELSDYLKEKK